MKTEISKISTKGKITLPKAFRDKLKLSFGDEVVLFLTENGILIKPKLVHLYMLRGLLQEEIDIEKAQNFINNERKKWRL